MAVGSLLQRLKEWPWTRPVHVWGSGYISAVRPHKTKHIVHALRGPASAKCLKTAVDDIALGDPGILAGMLLQKQPVKRHRLVIIPHYNDKGSAPLRQLVEANPGAKVLDIFSDPLTLLDDIAASELVLASALHGLIAADAVGTPNYRIKLTGNLRGGDFKFGDYYAALGIPEQAIEPAALPPAEFDRLVESYLRPGLTAIQEQLIASFPDLD
jgi:pyruvyltransferase